MSEQEWESQLHKQLESCSINFLFGAGVNGSAFPQMSSFTETEEMAGNIQSPPYDQNEGIEAYLGNSDLQPSDKENLAETFQKEFNNFLDSAHDGDDKEESLNNLKDLLDEAAKLVEMRETRRRQDTRINIFTLNYDLFVEEALDGLSRLYLTAVATRPYRSRPLELTVVNDVTRKLVCIFRIFKLHGTLTHGRLQLKDVVFGGEKQEVVLNGFFETLVHMKQELLKPNSVLFIVGYSGGDPHVNKIIADAKRDGLGVYYLEYKACTHDSALKVGTGEGSFECKTIPGGVKKVKGKDKAIDTTRTLADLLKKHREKDSAVEVY